MDLVWSLSIIKGCSPTLTLHESVDDLFLLVYLVTPVSSLATLDGNMNAWPRLRRLCSLGSPFALLKVFRSYSDRIIYLMTGTVTTCGSQERIGKYYRVGSKYLSGAVPSLNHWWLRLVKGGLASRSGNSIGLMNKKPRQASRLLCLGFQEVFLASRVGIETFLLMKVNLANG